VGCLSAARVIFRILMEVLDSIRGTAYGTELL